MRRAARVDSNQAEVVEALRKIGATVYVIGFPVDLLVGYKRKGVRTSILLEVKAPGGRLTDVQRDFFATFKGEAYIVKGIADALKAVRGK